MSCCKKRNPPSSENIFDKIFGEQMKKANALMGTLINPLDVEIGSKILRICEYYHGFCNDGIKENINKFMDYFLKLLYATCKQQPLYLYKEWFRTPQPIYKNDHTVSMWMQPNKNYLSSTKLCDGSFVFYLSLARTFNQKWVEKGLATLCNTNK